MIKQFASLLVLSPLFFAGLRNTAVAQKVAETGPPVIAASTTADASALDEVVVTGTRIARSGMTTPTPVTTVTADQINLASPGGMISDALNDLPQFVGSGRPQNPGSSVAGTAGASDLNLRGLGTNRLLVLLDGQRVVSSDVQGGVDVALLPNFFVQKVDIVTGGASAAYGSDAVAGVVNYVLDTKFNGLKGEADGGISKYGDAQSQKAGLAFGTDFAGGRGHFEASAEYYQQAAIGPYQGMDRTWVSRGAGVIPNPAGTPARLFVDSGVTLTGLNPPGIITGGPLKGTTFNPDGSPTPFHYGTDAGPLFQVGGDGVFQQMDLTGEIQRQSYFTRADFDVTDNFKVFAQGSFGQTTTNIQNYYWLVQGSSDFTVFSDNAYLSPAVKAAMAQDGISSFPLGRMMTENPLVESNNTSQLWRGVVGFKTDIGRFNVQGSFIEQRSMLRVDSPDLPEIRNMYAAADAVVNPANGQIVCRSTLQGYDPGCQPLNLFGVGAPSAAALQYIIGDEWRIAVIKERDANLSVSAPLFSLWASQPVAFAAGLEYRGTSGTQSVAPLGNEVLDSTGLQGLPTSFVGNPGGFVIANFKPLNGSYNIKEGFLEVDAPILSKVPFVDQLTLNAAVRSADYTTTGSVVSWKVGLDYKPFPDLRLRATDSRDVRGPDFQEYFSPVQNSGTTDVFDSRIGKFVNALGLISGNTQLLPEVAKTKTFGVIYQPAFVPGLSASVDYWSIHIDDAISSLTAQQTVDECAAGVSQSCANIIDLGGFYRILRPSLNLATISTSGIDIELDYTTNLGPGRGAVRVLATNTQSYTTQAFAGAPVMDTTGQVGTNPASPRWSANAQLTYNLNPLTVFLQERFISAGTYNGLYKVGVDIDHNRVNAAWYTDATAKWALPVGEHHQAQIFVSINNVFNEPPPLSPQTQASLIPAANYALYDPLGRYFTAGIQFSW